MAYLRISEAAAYLGVSDDPIRRWVQQGHLTATLEHTGHQVVAGTEIVELAQAATKGRTEVPRQLMSSACNELAGLVTKIDSDKIMSQIGLQSGLFRVASLISPKAVAELGLEVSSPAIATVKTTSVVIETTG